MHADDVRVAQRGHHRALLEVPLPLLLVFARLGLEHLDRHGAADPLLDAQVHDGRGPLSDRGLEQVPVVEERLERALELLQQ